MILKILSGVVVIVVLAVFVMRKLPSEVYVERTLDAPVAKVWSLWTDAEAMKNWWSPKDFTAPVIKNDFRVGGTYLFSMRSSKGEMYWNTGTYTEIVPNRKIVSTMSFSDENGRVVPGAEVSAPGEWPDEIVMTVLFDEVDGKTRVSVRETGMPMIMKLLAKMGWEQQFDKLEKLL